MNVVDAVENELENTPLVHEIETKSKNRSIVKKVIHGLAILLVPGFLIGTCLYYTTMMFRK